MNAKEYLSQAIQIEGEIKGIAIHFSGTSFCTEGQFNC